MKLVLGLMSGTSLDGVDVALLRTDGEVVETVGPFRSFPFDDAFRDKVQKSFGMTSDLESLEKEVTDHHIQAIERFLQSEGIARNEVDLIGFHGQTIYHEPQKGLTLQIGDAQAMAKAVGIDVVNDFRSADVKAGGQGAPLVPIYHRALTKDMHRPVAVLNLGGVGNVTWIGTDGSLLAFDTGPANALVDDWIRKHTDQPYDVDGKIAISGDIHDDCINSFMTHPYFSQPAPKSLDRDQFKKFAFELVDDLSVEDGAATLTAFSVAAVMRAQDFFPEWVESWIICGGGRLNKAMMSGFNAFLYGSVFTAEQVGWNGDAIEAQAFAYLAVRSEKGLPLTFPETTGVSAPLSGGMYHTCK